MCAFFKKNSNDAPETRMQQLCTRTAPRDLFCSTIQQIYRSMEPQVRAAFKSGQLNVGRRRLEHRVGIKWKCMHTRQRERERDRRMARDKESVSVMCVWWCVCVCVCLCVQE